MTVSSNRPGRMADAIPVTIEVLARGADKFRRRGTSWTAPFVGRGTSAFVANNTTFREADRPSTARAQHRSEPHLA